MTWVEAHLRWIPVAGLVGALLGSAPGAALAAADEPLVVCATAQAPAVRVLIVGNSYSTNHHLSARVQHVLQASGCFGTSLVVPVTRHGARLREVDLARLPALEPWDHVFLQDHSRAYLEGPRRAAEAVARIQAALRRDTRERVTLVETWADLAASPETREKIATHYADVAQQTGLGVVRVGPVFESAHLYASDGRHASPEGASLYACVLAREVMGRPAQALDVRRCASDLMTGFAATGNRAR